MKEITIYDERGDLKRAPNKKGGDTAEKSPSPTLKEIYGENHGEPFETSQEGAAQ